MLPIPPDTGLAEVEAKNKFLLGDAMDLILPGRTEQIRLDTIQDMQGCPMQEVPGGGYRVRIGLPRGQTYTLGLLARHLPA